MSQDRKNSQDSDEQHRDAKKRSCKVIFVKVHNNDLCVALREALILCSSQLHFMI